VTVFENFCPAVYALMLAGVCCNYRRGWGDEWNYIPFSLFSICCVLHNKYWLQIIV